MQQLDPAVWLSTAREHLAVAANVDDPIRMRCFHGQRAVELALKGVLVHHGVEFPYIHSLENLAKLLPEPLPERFEGIADLTPYAIQEMYPGLLTDLEEDHASDAVEIARAVGVTQPVIARLESGDHDPKLGTMLAVCRALGLPLIVGTRTVLAKGKPATRTA